MGREDLRGGMEWEDGDSRCKLLYIEWTDKVLLNSTENYIQYAVINQNAIYFKCKHVYVYTESLFCTAEMNIINQPYFEKKKL